MSQYTLHLSTSPRRRRKRFTWRGWTVLVICILFCITFVLPGYVGYSLTHPARKPITINPQDIGLTYQNVEFPSSDGVSLRGWFLPAANTDRVVIFAHGFRGNRADVPALPAAKALVQSGISALLFDFRDSGESGGNLVTVGSLEKNDLLAAIKYVESKGYGQKGIGLIGFSMGAATALDAAADAPEVQAVIADSPFADLDSYLHANMPVWSHLPNVPFTALSLFETALITGHNPSEVSPLHEVSKLQNRPILLIHGSGDKTIPYANSQELLAALHNPEDQLWTVNGADHVGTFSMEPVEYLNRVTSFFQAHLGK